MPRASRADRQEDGHLPTGQGGIGAEVAAAAARRDPGGDEGLDERLRWRAVAALISPGS
jgi:hypothetical protein